VTSQPIFAPTSAPLLEEADPMPADTPNVVPWFQGLPGGASCAHAIPDVMAAMHTAQIDKRPIASR
jgi:hypothetical protein